MDPQTRINRSRSFDSVAEQYERVRPSYPPESINTILHAAKLSPQSKVLEVGAGSGKATELLLPTGCSITCIEPGATLAAIIQRRFAKYPLVDIKISSFEDFQAPPASFDCIVAAQAFHWLDRETRFVKCHELLKPGGTIALLWNVSPRTPTPVYSEIYRIYDTIAGGLREPSNSNLEAATCIVSCGEELKSSSLFSAVELHRFPWSAHYTGEDFMALVGTYSNHRDLPIKIREELFSALENICATQNELIRKDYVSLLYLAKKRN